MSRLRALTLAYLGSGDVAGARGMLRREGLTDERAGAFIEALGEQLRGLQRR